MSKQFRPFALCWGEGHTSKGDSQTEESTCHYHLHNYHNHPISIASIFISVIICNQDSIMINNILRLWIIHLQVIIYTVSISCDLIAMCEQFPLAKGQGVAWKCVMSTRGGVNRRFLWILHWGICRWGNSLAKNYLQRNKYSEVSITEYKHGHHDEMKTST